MNTYWGNGGVGLANDKPVYTFLYILFIYFIYTRFFTILN